MRTVIIDNKRIIVAILMILSISIAVVLGLNTFRDAIETSSLPTFRRVIIIDPGHGGVDGGASGKETGVLEKDINLEISLKLKEILEESGSLVLLTRDGDYGLYTEGNIRQKKNEDLRNRKKIFDESEADAIISIHLNSFPQSKYYGAQTFYPSNSENSKLMATLIQEELIRVLNNGNTRKAKTKNDIYLLKKPKVPIVLVECGFLSNPKEEKLLQDSEYQYKIAWSIYVGMLRYFQRITN